MLLVTYGMQGVNKALSDKNDLTKRGLRKKKPNELQRDSELLSLPSSALNSVYNALSVYNEIR